MANEERASLIPYSETPSSYNFGPREKTDRRCGHIFVGLIGIFFVWGIASMASPKPDDAVFIGVSQGKYNEATGSCEPNKHHNSTGIVELSGAVQAVIIVPIVLSVVAAFGLGTLVVFGFKKAPDFMVWFVVVIKILTPAVLGIFLLVNSQSHFNAFSGDVEGGITMPVVVLFFVSALLALLFWCMRLTLKVVARLFKVSGQALQDSVAMIPVQSAIAFGGMVLQAAMIMLTLASVGWGRLLPAWPLDADGNPDKDQSPTCQWSFASNTTYAFALLAVITIYWFVFFVLTFRTYIIGDTVAHWYWHGAEAGNITRAIKNGAGPHMGSIAFAGLVLMIVEWMKAIARRKSDNILCCMIQMIIRCILSYIEFLCKMSVIVIGITAQPFVSAGKTVVRLFTESFGNMALSTGVWWIPGMILGTFVFIMSVVWGVITGAIVYGRVMSMNSSQLPDDADSKADFAQTVAILVGCSCGMMVMFILAFFAKMLESYIDTVFMCFLIDKSKGVITKPEIHEVLGEVLERQGKSVHADATFSVQDEPYPAGPPPPAYSAQQPRA